MANAPVTLPHTLTGSSASGSKDGRDLFIAASGSNTIFNYGSEDTIQMNVTGSSVIDGTDDVQLTGSGGTTLIVKNAKGRALGITADGKTTSYAYYGGKYSKSPQDVIQLFMSSLDTTNLSGSDALDEAVNAASGGDFTKMSDLIKAAVSDCSLHGGDTFLRQDCGIVLGNADTGAISGWDAASSPKSKTGISIVPEESPNAIDTTFTANSFTTKGLTFVLEKDFSKLSAVQKGIWQGLKTWWAEQSLDLISESYGSNFSFNNANVNTITVKFISKSGSTLAAVQNTTINGVVSALELQINMKYYKGVDIDNVNGKSSDASAGYLDRTLAHEMTHAIMAATIANFNDLPSYIKEGMAELTHGIDDERSTSISSLANNASNLEKALVSNTTTVSVGSINAPSYAGGYILLRYMANKFSTFSPSNGSQAASSGYVSDDELVERESALTYNSGRTAVTVTANYTETSLTPATYGDAITAIDATNASQPLSIVGGIKATTITMGAKGGTLQGGASGADKLYGGSGEDVFVYSVGGGGADVVGNTKTGASSTLYEAQDKIVVLTTVSADNANGYVGFKDSKSALTLSFKGDKSAKLTINKKAADTPVTIELRSATDGSLLKTVNHNSTLEGVSLTNNYTTALVSASVASGSTINASEMNSQIKIIDARTATVPTYLVGNVQATTVSLGTGGGTVTGAYDNVNDKAFNDVFYGGSGADVFVYSIGGGNDVINNYDGSHDRIVLQGVDDVTTITGSSNTVSYAEKGSNLVLTFTNKNNKKSTLTINNPLGLVSVYKESDLADPILTNGVALPDYTGYNKNKTAVTLAAAANESTEAQSSTISIDLIGDGYSDNIKEIDASKFVGSVELVGNAKANALKSAIGGGTLEGGSGTKATGDKLYGNAGSDVFIYRLVKGVGGGTDIIGGDANIKNGDYDEQDKIYITSDTGLSKSDITITDKNKTVTLKFNGDSRSQLTINKATDNTPIKFYLGASDTELANIPLAFTYGEMPDYAGYGDKKGKTDYTTLTVGGAASGETLDTTDINSQIKTINMSAQANDIYLLGNANANVISVGAGGGTIDAGAGNDKVFGNSSTTAATTFVHNISDGNLEINGYYGSKDVIFIGGGYTSTINSSNKSVFKDSGKDITLTLNSGTTKSKVVIKSVTGKLSVVGKDANDNPITLLSYGADLPDPSNMGFNTAKTVMTIGSGAQLGGVDTFKLSDFGISLKELDASAYSANGLHLIAADGKVNILRAGGGDSTLEGSTGNDKLYGNSGADSFVYSVGGGGKDEIYSLNGGQGDEIILLGYTGSGIETSLKSAFADSGKDITLTLGGNKLAIKNPTGQLNVYKGSLDADGNIVKGDSVLSYDTNLPDGLEYNVGKTSLTFAGKVDDATDDYTVDASVKNAYSVKLVTVDASKYDGAVDLIGNANNNVLYSGKGGGTLNGGAGADKLYGASVSQDVFVFKNDGSKDIVYNYDYANGGDVIKLDELSGSAKINATYNGKTLVLTYSDKGGTLTINGKSTGNNKYETIDTTTTIAIQIGDDDVKTYQFTNTKTKGVDLSKITSDTAIVSSPDVVSNEQLPSARLEDYWFEGMTDGSAPGSELDEIMKATPPTELAADDTDFNELKKRFNHTLGLNTVARHVKK